ncbi:uncharacterized protein At1g01500-like [Coffea arabica]|uniref:Uncharacterized protein At1g01500-like n=1 Tax=Coffea arabica TaxID=13443 RepID=A0A6P6USY3_COFAR|nr:uncharacterized protein At1g01500-like [Coffea arabica]
MDSSHESLNNGKPADPALQIIRHPAYQSHSKLVWLDIRVFYVRISSFMVDDSTPECLTLNHIPLSPDTLLEVNGARCSIYSEGSSCILRRDRLDKKSEEATFVSTDSIRLSGSVKFEVFHKEDLVLSGVLEMSCSNGFTSKYNGNPRKWSMNCETVMSAGAGFLKGKHIISSESSSPTIEVYVAGCFLGAPVILTKTLQFNHRKKPNRKVVLDSIPEYDTAATNKDDGSRADLQVTEDRSYKPESEEELNNMYWRRMEYIEGEDGEISWFNAGVRVGVGIGLGICLGVGIGVGLLVRTYQATTGSFRRRLM